MDVTLPPPFHLIRLARVDSTNDEAKRQAEAGAGHGTVVWADEQTAGRGRRGRSWVSIGGNLLFSVLLDPGPAIGAAPQLAFVAAVALRQALTRLVPTAMVEVKWPNDVLIGGRKVSGMLLELASSQVILGIGVNVVEAPEVALYPAASLRQSGSPADAGEVLVEFCRALGHWYGIWREHGLAPVREAWLAGACGLGGPIKVRLSEERILEGRFSGLDQAGVLLLEGDDGTITPVLAGDVFFG